MAKTKIEVDINIDAWEVQQERCNAFNADNEVGTAVRFKGDKSMVPDHTWSAAYVLVTEDGDHLAVVELEGQNDGEFFPLDDLEVVE